MQPVTDMSWWDRIKSGLIPLKKTHQQPEFPVRLRVRRKPKQPLANTLDLHSQTVQEAYLSTQKFIQTHS